jgi:uncharacterized protein
MSDQLVIDPAKFARGRNELRGELQAAQLPRVVPELFDTEGGVGYAVSGFQTAKGEPALRVEIHGTLALRCERCLNRLDFALDSHRVIVLAQGVDEFTPVADEDETIDTIPAVARLDVGALLEDEVLLSLPMAPRHAEGECRAEGTQQDAPASSPFAVLANLRH